MLAWFVIDRTYSRQFLQKSSTLRTPSAPTRSGCLCVAFSDSLRPTSVVPTTYALPVATAAPQPLCNQSVTHSFYLDGGCVPLFPTCQHSNLPMFQRVSKLSPLFSHSCALFCTFLHSRKTQLFSFQAFPHSLAKTPGVGVGGAFVAAREFL